LPTHEELASFWNDWKQLTRDQKRQFQAARKKLVADLRTGKGFRTGLCIKRVQKVPGVYEMTWTPDGRATFEFGKEVLPGEQHIIWRRIGGHEILDQP
jgi:hypothetical protein